jgi:hypothetical protein
MWLINQFSALLLFVVPLGLFISYLWLRQRELAGRWWLLGLGLASSLLIIYLMTRFQTGAAGTTTRSVEDALDQVADGRPLFVELYSDY